MKSCEYKWLMPGPCGKAAAWNVAIGTRRTDAQDSCRRHLSPTCDLMLRAEDRPATLTVTHIAKWAVTP